MLDKCVFDRTKPAVLASPRSTFSRPYPHPFSCSIFSSIYTRPQAAGDVMVKKQSDLAKTAPNPSSRAGKGTGSKSAQEAFDRKTLQAIRAQLVAEREKLLEQ